MNTSFSKKRYIAEVNQKLEERYLSDKIKFVLNEQDKEYENRLKRRKIKSEFLSKYPGCFESLTFYNDGTFRDPKDIDTVYYSNGQYKTPQGKGTYSCVWTEDATGNRKKEIKRGAITNSTYPYIDQFFSGKTNNSNVGPLASNPQFSSSEPEVKTGESKPAKKIYNSAKDIKTSTEEGVRTIKNDPYEYKLIKCVWHFRKGPKNVKDWKSLANNQEAKNILNSKFPNDIKDCPKSTSSAYQSQDSEIDPKYQDTPSPASSASPTTSKDVFRKAMSNVPDYPKPDEKVY
jgi:hypothetical protein